jgi:signal transduction histidine kinase
MKSKEMISDIEEWRGYHNQYMGLDLSKSFSPVQVLQEMPTEEEIKAILVKTNKFTVEDELNCRACGYSSCREKAIAVWRGIAEVEMCLPYLISKLEHTIADLTENQAKLIQAEKLASMGQMAAGIAHEINNPLGVVLMYAHILKEELAEEKTMGEDVDTIINEAERTRQIVRRILNFAREERIERSPADINRLLRTAGEQVQSHENGDKVVVEYNLDATLEMQEVDSSQLKQVFDNILKNAVEVMPEGGTVTIESQSRDTDFVVLIKDEGPGIPEEHQSKLFSPFFTTKPVGQGTGLGLPVCYGIVKMHGGSIQAGNNPDGGAYFEITIKKTMKEEAVV